MMPAQKPSTSKQDYGTPLAFIAAVEARFGKLDVDLAASPQNAKAPLFLTKEDDVLSLDWTELGTETLNWLNPEFREIAKYAVKCATSGARILFLVPASVGANWYWDHVHGKCLVLQVGRMCFQGCHVLDKETRLPRCGGDELCDGCANYPKDLMLCCYGYPPGIERWLWKHATLGACAPCSS